MPIVHAIAAQPPADDACLKQPYDEAQQLAFGMDAIRRYGYDFERGRQDKTHHPFMTKFSLGDVRITTRVDPNDLGQALFSTLHEAGHALYEQGINMDYEGTPLANGTSAGVHESQSRLWENIVGRSRGFWQFFYPRLQAAFPEQLGQVSLDTFYRAINKVERSLIRTDADEVTYNLHVMMRFDFELELLEGKLELRDLPEAWWERMKSDLGMTPPDDRDGVLQDVHWYAGTIGGAFQGYTHRQYAERAVLRRCHPRAPADRCRDRSGRVWHAARLAEAERLPARPQVHRRRVVERATGGPLSFEPYIRYLREKYGELYSL